MPESNPFIQESPQGIRVSIKVQPGSAHAKIVGVEKDQLKIKLTSPPVEGAANKEMIRILQKTLKIPKKNIKIIRGEKSRTKLVEILGITMKDFLTAV